MQMITATCPACLGSFGGRVTSRYITCAYCGTRFALGKDELDAMGFVDADGDGFDDNDVDGFDAELEEDTGSDPMYIFARDACAALLEDVDASYFSSSNKIVRGLGITGGEIYLIHDDTMFKSGKDGFAITSDGIYCREMGEKTAHFVSWEKLASGKALKLDGSYIRQGATSLCYFSDNSDVCEDELFPLFRRLYNHARRVS